MKHVILLLFLLQMAILSGQNKLIQKAIEAYNNKDYDKTIEYYDSLLNQGYVSKGLYYNLGNAYYNIDSLGNAMLYYEKALKLDPGNRDIKHNIFLTRRKLDSEIAELPEFFLFRWWNDFSSIFGLKTWTFFALFFGLSMALSAFFFWFGNNLFLKSKFKIVSVLSFVLMIVSLLAANRVKNRIYENTGHVLINRDSVFIAPDIRSEKLYDLKPGEKMFKIDSIKDWYKVKLLNQDKVWIRKKSVKKI